MVDGVAFIQPSDGEDLTAVEWEKSRKMEIKMGKCYSFNKYLFSPCYVSGTKVMDQVSGNNKKDV